MFWPFNFRENLQSKVQLIGKYFVEWMDENASLRERQGSQQCDGVCQQASGPAEL